MIALWNTISRCLDKLGLEKAKDAIPQIGDYLKQKREPGRPPRVRVAS
jgi:hypothetical protein